MTDKEKIRAYIEKLHKEHRGSEGDSIFRRALRTVLFYIDSMQEDPVSEDLEQAIDTYLATYWGGEKEKKDWPFLKKMAIHFANWQKQEDSIPVSEDMREASKQYALRQVLASTDTRMSEQAYLDLRLFSGLELAVAHKDGANWQKQQMMKDAISGKVTVIYYPTDSCLEIEATLPEDRFEDGDKVLIIKED